MTETGMEVKEMSQRTINAMLYDDFWRDEKGAANCGA
jgi:hypothetical protein